MLLGTPSYFVDISRIKIFYYIGVVIKLQETTKETK